MSSDDALNVRNLLDRSPANQLHQALLHLVDRGRRVDEALLAEAAKACPNPRRLSDLMALKRWIMHGLFEIAPRALEANSLRRGEILALLNSFRESHLQVEARLGEKVRQMENEIEAGHKAEEALGKYAADQSRQRHLRAA